MGRKRGTKRTPARGGRARGRGRGIGGRETRSSTRRQANVGRQAAVASLEMNNADAAALFPPTQSAVASTSSQSADVQVPEQQPTAPVQGPMAQQQEDQAMLSMADRLLQGTGTPLLNSCVSDNDMNNVQINNTATIPLTSSCISGQDNINNVHVRRADMNNINTMNSGQNAGLPAAHSINPSTVLNAMSSSNSSSARISSNVFGLNANIAPQVNYPSHIPGNLASAISQPYLIPNQPITGRQVMSGINAGSSMPIVNAGVPLQNTVMPSTNPSNLLNPMTPYLDSNSAISNNEAVQQQQLGFTPLVSVCSQVGGSVPQNIRQKIFNGEYIDLALLLMNPEPDQWNNGGQPVALSVDQEGNIVWKKDVAKSKITSIKAWTDAFLVFTSVFLEAHPTRAQELLKYMTLVRFAASKFGGWGWRSYDQQFRMRQQAHPNRSWAVIEGELWALYVAVPMNRAFPTQPFPARGSGSGLPRSQLPRSQFVRRSTTGPYNRPQTQSFLSKDRICFPFNKGSCTRNDCWYSHKCSKCRAEGHGASRCKVKGGQ